MLSKLFKHEMKATSRILLPIYLILVVLTILDRIVLHLDIFKGTLAIIPGFVTIAYIATLIAIIVVSFVIVILRFYKNLMSDEGYLMFTLPVKSHQLINSKLIASILWTVASFAAVIASLFLVFITPERMETLKDLFQIFKAEMESDLGSISTLIIIEIIVMTVIGVINNILQIYASIALGQLFNGHKVIGSFAAYIAINTLTQIISLIIIMIGALIFGDSFVETSSTPQFVFPLSILLIMVFNVVYYWIIDFIFKRKLNLD